MYTIEELTLIAEEFLWNTYNLKLKIPILRNNRLTRTLGWYVIHWKTEEPEKIELSGNLFKYAHQDVVVDTLKHELVHYALNVLGKPNNDGDTYFEDELRRLGISSSETAYVGKLYRCRCRKCNSKISATRKCQINTISYISSCCRSIVELERVDILDGTEDIVFSW